MRKICIRIRDYSLLMPGTGVEGIQIAHENIYDHYVGLCNKNYNKCWSTNFYYCLEISENGEKNKYLPQRQRQHSLRFSVKKCTITFTFQNVCDSLHLRGCKIVK